MMNYKNKKSLDTAARNHIREKVDCLYATNIAIASLIREAYKAGYRQARKDGPENSSRYIIERIR